MKKLKNFMKTLGKVIGFLMIVFSMWFTSFMIVEIFEINIPILYFIIGLVMWWILELINKE